MTVKQYLLHQNLVKRERITLRACVLFCLKTINGKRIKDREEATKRRKLNDGESSSSGSSSGGGGGAHTMAISLSTGVGQFVNTLKRDYESQIKVQRREIEAQRRNIEALRNNNESLRNNNENNTARNNKYLDGVHAEEKITAFELWREIVMWL